MNIIGLCGGSGSGKSTLSAYLLELGADVIDADAIARSLTSPGSPLIQDLRKTFGEGIISEDGSLDRPALAAIVFGDQEQLTRLNAMMHPEITKKVKERIRTSQAQTIVIDAAVLHQAGLETLCDKVVFVTAPVELRIRRIMERDGISRQVALKRIQAQPTDEEYQNIATITIQNDGTRSVKELAKELL